MNLTNWEEGVVEDVTCHKILEICKRFMDRGVQGPAKPRPRTFHAFRQIFSCVADQDFATSAFAKARDGQVHLGDVVLFRLDGRHAVGELPLNVCVPGCHYAVVSVWNALPRGSADFVSFSVEDNTVLLPLNDIAGPLAHNIAADRSQCCVYLPLQHRL